MCSTFLVMFVDTSTLYSQVIMPGEELLYEVSYMGITLGSIKVVTLKNEIFDGKNVYHSKIYIDSRKVYLL